MLIDASKKTKVLASEFGAKFRSKREIYTFLTVDCKAYLPHVGGVTIYFCKDLIASKKKM